MLENVKDCGGLTPILLVVRLTSGKIEVRLPRVSDITEDIEEAYTIGSVIDDGTYLMNITFESAFGATPTAALFRYLIHTLFPELIAEAARNERPIAIYSGWNFWGVNGYGDLYYCDVDRRRTRVHRTYQNLLERMERAEAESKPLNFTKALFEVCKEWRE